ncbi:hypothetical protein AC249_AIPGENE6883 [Exaiptasia diaphana]|nr:hypothetical protein AC249_AIPGENE6883 [Exaiptasia diaphana]
MNLALALLFFVAFVSISAGRFIADEGDTEEGIAPEKDIVKRSKFFCNGKWFCPVKKICKLRCCKGFYASCTKYCQKCYEVRDKTKPCYCDKNPIVKK